MKKNNFILILILFLTLLLRLYKTGEAPPGFYSDEALDGYEAYSILKTAKDQYGNFLPLSFRAFGDFRPGLFIYSLVPSIALFGLTEFAVRLPSAIYSSILVLVTYLLGSALFKNKKAGLLACFWLSISLFSLQFSRMAHDTNLATLLISMAVLFFVYGLEKEKYLIFSIIVFGISLYVYYNTRVFSPLMFLFLLFNYKTFLLRSKKTLFIGAILGLFIILPLISVSRNKELLLSRVSVISLWSDKGILAQILEERKEDTYKQSPFSRIYHNKITDGITFFYHNYLRHVNPDFLIFNGDPDNLYKIPNSGIIYWIDPFILIIGLFYLFKMRHNSTSTILLWLSLGLLADSLTKLAPSASRIHLILPCLALVIGFSIYRIKKVTVIFLLIFVYTFNFAYFLHNYFFHFPVRFAKEWHYGLKNLVKETQDLSSDYDQIWVSRTAWGWINFLFYLKYPPEKIQKEINLSEKNEFGLGWVFDFDKYHFDYFPKKIDFTKKILYVGEPDEFPKAVKPLEIFYYPDGSQAFYLVSSDGLKEISGY